MSSNKTLFHYVSFFTYEKQDVNKRMIAVAYVFDPNTSVVSYNYCLNHPKEQPSRKNGRKLALERLHATPIKVNVLKNERPLEKIMWHISNTTKNSIIQYNVDRILYEYIHVSKKKFLEKNGFFSNREID